MIFQLNPFSDGMFNVIKEIFEEYQEIFDYDSFHIGGDEVIISSLQCYISFQSRVKY